MPSRKIAVRGHMVERNGRTFRRRAHERHLYSNPRTRGAVERDFEERYGKKKGRYVYGATVGKVRREQIAKRRKARKRSY